MVLLPPLQYYSSTTWFVVRARPVEVRRRAGARWVDRLASVAIGRSSGVARSVPARALGPVRKLARGARKEVLGRRSDRSSVELGGHVGEARLVSRYEGGSCSGRSRVGMTASIVDLDCRLKSAEDRTRMCRRHEAMRTEA